MSPSEETMKRAREKGRIAWNQRLAGMTWVDIAAQDYEGKPMYTTDSGAYRAAMAYARSQDLDTSLADQRREGLARYDALQRVVWRKAMAGDLAALKLALEIMKNREKLAGVQGYQPPEAAMDPLDELTARREGRTG